MRNEHAVQSNRSTSKAWLRALELTAPIAGNRERTLPVVIEEAALRFGDAPALLSARQQFTYRGLVARSNQYARWALGQGLSKGDVVGLLMANQPEYMAIWLGITSVGVVVALLNTNLTGPSLAHSIGVVSPRCIIAHQDCLDRLTSALIDLEASPELWIYKDAGSECQGNNLDVSLFSSEALLQDERRGTSIDDRALYIYTSGTTGLPKAANVSHARMMQWSHWFAGMMEVSQTDRLYNCLPMYHSVGGVQAPGAVLAAGGSVVIREKFSTSQFWSDICRWDCTLFQYIGELCRYLLHGEPSPDETRHRIRLACGNGLAPDVWDPFKDRFRIPCILEFYAATEGSFSLFNVEEKRGSIGRIPAYLAHRFSPALVMLDMETGEPARNEQGHCIRCVPNQPGEAISKAVNDPSNVGSRYEGYTTQNDTERNILRDVFERGDTWIRTGDLMRKDEKGFFYFVDRIGDTFRWKGENVSASEVSETICEFPGVRHAKVYGVAIPSTEGRAGMAALVTDSRMDMQGFRVHLAVRLPSYARPVFLRIRSDMEVTGTFKYSKTDLACQGFDPTATKDTVYFDNRESQAFVRVDKALYDRIQAGQIRF
jgi:fatty-acyl-CoA synthase